MLEKKPGAPLQSAKVGGAFEAPRVFRIKYFSNVSRDYVLSVSKLQRFAKLRPEVMIVFAKTIATFHIVEQSKFLTWHKKMYDFILKTKFHI